MVDSTRPPALADVPPTVHDAYLLQHGGEALARLLAIRRVVQEQVPAAEPCMGYGLPAFRQGRIFVYVGVFKRHIGVYPPVQTVGDLAVALAPYQGPKGNLVFPHSQPLPLALLKQVVATLHRSYATPLA